MDLSRAVVELLAPVEIGGALGDGFVLHDVSTELGPRVIVRRGDAEVVVELSMREAGLAHLVATDRFALAYRGETNDGPAACRVVAARVAANEARVLASLAPRDERGRVREVTVTRALEPMGPVLALSPYVGCLVGCRFCYAQQRLHAARRMLGLEQAPWGSWVDARINIAEVLADELARGVSRPIKLCPIVSDPYQAIETRYRLTRACVDVLARAAAPPPTMVLTRSAKILEDLPRWAALPRAWVGVSLPSLDADALAHFEPRAASPSERLSILAHARALGLRTMAIVQPPLPGPLHALADALAEHADSVHVAALDGEQGASADFDDPRYTDARTAAWQRERVHALTEALQQRGVPLWRGELPPELEDPA